MTEPQSTRSHGEGGLRPWFSPGRKRFWAVVLLLAYSLFGFFGAPPLVRHLVVNGIAEQAGRSSELDEVRINPFLGTVDARGFRVFDTDGVALIQFDRLFVDFQFTGVFRWAWTFRAIHLQGFDGLVERYAAGDTRLARLLTDIEQRAATSTEPEENDALPRLLVQELLIENGAATIRDQVPGEPVELRLGPVSAAVHELNTLPDRDGRQSVEVTMPDGSKVRWQGNLRVGPMHSEGRIEIEGSQLGLTVAYLKPMLPLTGLEATLSVRTGYRISEGPGGAFELTLEELQAELVEAAVTGLEPEETFLAFDALAISGGQLEYPARALSLDAVRVENPRFLLHRDAGGSLSIDQLAAAMNTGEETGGADGSPWRIEINRFEIDGGSAEFRDASLQPTASLRLDGLELALQQISSAEGQRMPLAAAGAFEGGGQWAFDGNVVALPEAEGAGTLRVEALALPQFQPYVAEIAEVTVESGALSGAFQLALPAGAAPTVAGEIAVSALAVQDTRRQQPLVGWERMDLDRFEADLAAGRLELSRIDLTRPYGRLTIFEDQTTNLAGLLKESPVDDADAAEGAPASADPGAPPMAFVLGGVAVTEGALDFTDRSLPLPFATEIRQLGGTVSTLDSRSAEPANVRFEGQVDEFGLARIDGSLNPLDPLHRTNISMEFRNLLMSNLSPYSVQFAGREIAEGKLDLDLLYRIDGGMMQGQNNIVMSDLVLGDEVDAPGAASLPLGLAVALLKDADGVIDIELPVEGDVNDPEFRIGGVVWQAIVGLVTKVVTAPFRLLGSLIGADSEDIGSIQFLPGRADLTPPEREKIGLLQQALDKRPELRIEIGGSFDPALDRPALQFFRLRERVLALLEERSRLEQEDFRMLDDELRGALETLYLERFPGTSLESIREGHRASEEQRAAGAPEFDQLAYAGELRDRLLESEAVGQEDLLALAEQRAASVRDTLAEAGVAEERMAGAEPAERASEDGEWVLMELGVAVE